MLKQSMPQGNWGQKKKPQSIQANSENQEAVCCQLSTAKVYEGSGNYLCLWADQFSSTACLRTS